MTTGDTDESVHTTIPLRGSGCVVVRDGPQVPRPEASADAPELALTSSKFQTTIKGQEQQNHIQQRRQERRIEE